MDEYVFECTQLIIFMIEAGFGSIELINRLDTGWQLEGKEAEHHILSVKNMWKDFFLWKTKRGETNKYLSSKSRSVNLLFF